MAVKKAMKLRAKQPKRIKRQKAKRKQLRAS